MSAAPRPSTGFDPSDPDSLPPRLTVELAREPSGLALRYLHPDSSLIASLPSRPLPLLSLDDADGEGLFRLLFPDPATTTRVLRALFASDPQSQPTPPRAPVRLRIATQDPALIALPYQRMAFRGELGVPATPLLLDGWTFEVSPTASPTAQRTLLPPAKILLLPLAGAPAAPFQSAVQELLQRLRPGTRHEALFRSLPAQDLNLLPQVLRELRPHLILGHGAGDASGYTALRHGDLLRAIATIDPLQRPLVALLTGPPGSLAPGFESGAQALCSEIPVVIAARPQAPAQVIESQLIAGLGRFLEHGVNPVQALHDHWPALPAAPVVVHAAYADLAIRPEEARREDGRSPPPEHAALLLDRDEPRAIFDKHVLELRESRDRRVELVIAYAEHGNLLESFAAQATDYVQRSRGAATLHHARLLFPGGRQHLRERLGHDLRSLLQVEAHTPLSAVLRAFLRGRRGEGRRATAILLDYQVFGEREGLPEPLDMDQLQDVLAFCREQLDRACPDDLRVVVYLAFEVPAERQPGFVELINSLMEDPFLYTDRFRFTTLPALGPVTLRHMHEFLSNRDRSRCPPSLARDVALQIHRASAGVYEKAVRYLQQAETTTYEQVLRELSATSKPVSSTGTKKRLF